MSRRPRGLVRIPGSGVEELDARREQRTAPDAPDRQPAWLKLGLKLGVSAAALGGAYALGWSNVEPAQGTIQGGTPLQALQREDAATASPTTPAGTVSAPAGPPAPSSRRLGTEEIREVQAKLQELGHDPGPVDGLHGPQTVSAVKRYEIALGLEPTGNIDQYLLERLRREP